MAQKTIVLNFAYLDCAGSIWSGAVRAIARHQRGVWEIVEALSLDVTDSRLKAVYGVERLALGTGTDLQAKAMSPLLWMDELETSRRPFISFNGKSLDFRLVSSSMHAWQCFPNCFGLTTLPNPWGHAVVDGLFDGPDVSVAGQASHMVLTPAGNDIPGNAVMHPWRWVMWQGEYLVRRPVWTGRQVELKLAVKETLYQLLSKVRKAVSAVWLSGVAKPNAMPGQVG